MNFISDLARRIPTDVKQAICSLFVSACLITASMLMLGSYLDSLGESEGDREVIASAVEPTEESPDDSDTP